LVRGREEVRLQCINYVELKVCWIMIAHYPLDTLSCIVLLKFTHGLTLEEEIPPASLTSHATDGSIRVNTKLKS
jgi:hypothetical protein